MITCHLQEEIKEISLILLNPKFHHVSKVLFSEYLSMTWNRKSCKSSFFTHLPLICPCECFRPSSLQNKATSWMKYPVWIGPHLRSSAQEAYFHVVFLLHLSGPFHLAPDHLSFSPLYHSLSDRRERPQPLFMTAVTRQFSCVNDKRCANYLPGCFRANQTLTSCERVGVHVLAPQHEGRLEQALGWILMTGNLGVIAAWRSPFL